VQSHYQAPNHRLGGLPWPLRLPGLHRPPAHHQRHLAAGRPPFRAVPWFPWLKTKNSKLLFRHGTHGKTRKTAGSIIRSGAKLSLWRISVAPSPSWPASFSSPPPTTPCRRSSTLPCVSVDSVAKNKKQQTAFFATEPTERHGKLPVQSYAQAPNFHFDEFPWPLRLPGPHHPPAHHRRHIVPGGPPFRAVPWIPWLKKQFSVSAFRGSFTHFNAT